MPTESPGPAAPEVGDRVELSIGRWAHGGHGVARYAGRVVFVRHTLPGERVVAEVTGSGKGGRFLRADAVHVLQAAPERVPPPCPWSGPGRCGGCDLQHVDLAAQRRLKAGVVAEQLSRLAGVDLAVQLGEEVVCEPVPGDEDGLGWRTRVEFAVDEDGRPGLRRHRSREVVPVDDCLIADRRVIGTGVLGRRHPDVEALDVIAPGAGPAVVVPLPARDSQVPTVVEPVELGRDGDGDPDIVEFGVAARGFWQVHPGAAATFVATVLAGLDPQPGESALDLYAGVGLFAAALAERVGPTGEVVAVESDPVAVQHGQDNLRHWPHAELRRDRVDRAVRVMSRQGTGERWDLVVLDPPRIGAGRRVVEGVVALGPRAVAYVACDPAALGRDTAYLVGLGWALTRLRVLDAFPMTHHVECVAVFEPVRQTGGLGAPGARPR
ncbi:MAG: class I SAM-dependent RNA methyltransferase [Ornithinimicrobium sp.]|uniref:class I SAM-dependent RNA methyltransferase n=1 Tax=Ornithinimicrobium sp. TaxID=1977084 RepID=UPI003D9B3FE9